MNSKIIFSGLFGALIGAAVSYFFTKRYYEKLADEEIQSVKDSFNKCNNRVPVTWNHSEDKRTEKDDDTVDPSQMDVKEYAKWLQTQKKTQYSKSMKEIDKTVDNDPIRVIPYADFLEEDWPHVTLYHYANDILTDEENCEFNEDNLPNDWRECYEMYDPEDDTTIYTVNEKTRMYYEIIQCPNSFNEDVVGDDDDDDE